jgi:hypothetical protein
MIPRPQAVGEPDIVRAGLHCKALFSAAVAWIMPSLNVQGLPIGVVPSAASSP